MTSKRTVLAVAAALGLAGGVLVAVPAAQAAAPDSACPSRTNNSVRKILECVTVAGVMEHEQALQDIADANDGNRASATSGHDASADYVAARLQAAGYNVTIQEFPFFLFRELGPSQLVQTAPGQVTYSQNVDFIVTPQSEDGDVTAAVTPVDLQLGLGNTATSGCEAADFAGFPAGTIALLQRGACTFQLKAENAAAAGAVGVLFFNQGDTTAPDRQGLPAVTLTAAYRGGIPALSTTYARGVEFANTPGLSMRLFANVSRGPAVTKNVIAESRGGDAKNVVMAGAHLDSVAAGPGINDDGSGSSALIEVAEQLAKVKLANKVRFAWWGAEEDGLVGSTYYVNSLSAEQKTNIEMYLNFDMIASPNYGLFRYDGDGSDFGLVGPPGSDDIEGLFTRYYTERNLPTESSAFNGRSDYQAFINNGIPAGGLFTGAEGVKTAAQAVKWGGTAGAAYDECYHQACDTIDNVNTTALGINADAIAYAMFLYATKAEVITP